MSNTPPPIPDYQPQFEEKSSGKGWAIGCGSGCLILVLLGGVLAYFGWVKTKDLAAGYIEEYTADAPVVLEAPEAEAATVDSVVASFDAFSEAMEDEGEAKPLSLTAEEINLLIHNHPDWKDIAGHASVEIEEDQLIADVSISLDEMGSWFAGRYLNGRAALRLELREGKLEVYIDGLEVAGKALPAQAEKALIGKNIFEGAKSDPEMEKLLGSLESVSIESGRLIIVPRSVSERGAVEAPEKPEETVPAVEAEANPTPEAAVPSDA